MEPRCKKCGRPLRDSQSIARGMGAECAGIAPTRRRRVQVAFKGSTGLPNSDPQSSQMPSLLPGECSTKHRGTSEDVRERRAERRRLFETRLPFQCGVVLPARNPLVYTPLSDGSWRESPGGRIIAHERLHDYLMRYHFI